MCWWVMGEIFGAKSDPLTTSQTSEGVCTSQQELILVRSTKKGTPHSGDIQVRHSN